MSVSAVFARELKAARGPLNARVAAAQAQSGFDTGALAGFLRRRLDPLAQAVEAVAPERTAAVVDAGFEMALTLTAKGLAGPAARSSVVDDTWAELAGSYAWLIAQQPSAVLGGLSNATLHIAATPGARVERWRALMAALAAHATGDTWRALGQIAAWRAGMAHYRDGALAAADTLPASAALAALGADGGDWPAVRAALAANRWWSGGDGAAERRVGGFAGFGGPFAEPPEIVAGAEGLLVRSGERVHLLVADAFGATLHPSTLQAFQDAAARAPPRPNVRGVAVEAADRTVAVDLPAKGLAAVTDGATLAVASPFSHTLRLYPWRRP